MQFSNGDRLLELLANVSEHDRAEHDPFIANRQFGHITRSWTQTKNDRVLQTALAGVLGRNLLIKHCYELNPWFSIRLAKAAAKTRYRHIWLERQDELSRLISIFIAKSIGWPSKKPIAQTAAELSSGIRKLRPLPIEAMLAYYQRCRRAKDDVRRSLRDQGAGVHDVDYEMMFAGPDDTRLANFRRLLEFLGLQVELTEQRRAAITRALARPGPDFARFEKFVPNLEEAISALTAAGCSLVDGSSSHSNGADARKEIQERPRAPAVSGFFDQYPIFATTSKTSDLVRLNYRHRLFMEPNRELFRDKRVIDVASHDGRWSFAALAAGAKFVLGIEARSAQVEDANETFEHYQIAPQRYAFVCGDVHDELAKLAASGEKFDVALILGFLYHTARQYEILQAVAAMECRHVIVDTMVVRNSTKPVLKLFFENTCSERNIYVPGRASALASRPSITAMQYFLAEFGYRTETLVPPSPMPRRGANDYRNGTRFAFLASK